MQIDSKKALRNSICGLQRPRIAFKRISRTNGRLLAITVYRADKQLYEHLPFRCEGSICGKVCIHRLPEGSEKSLSREDTLDTKLRGKLMSSAYRITILMQFAKNIFLQFVQLFCALLILNINFFFPRLIESYYTE